MTHVPPPKEELGLAPISALSVAEVPRAGQQELVEFKNDRGRILASLTMWCGLTLIAAAVTAALLPEGFFAYGLFLLTSIAFGAVGARRFWQLSGKKAWKALPEGASEDTAQLEDAAAESVRVWNREAKRWNTDLAALNAEIAAWRKRGEDPKARDEEWCEETHAMERDTLMTKGLELTIRRKNLFASRREIRRATRLLTARMTPPESPPNSDPEPDDG